jgi:hypothetical protein
MKFDFPDPEMGGFRNSGNHSLHSVHPDRTLAVAEKKWAFDLFKNIDGCIPDHVGINNRAPVLSSPLSGSASILFHILSVFRVSGIWERSVVDTSSKVKVCIK